MKHNSKNGKNDRFNDFELQSFKSIVEKNN